MIFNQMAQGPGRTELFLFLYLQFLCKQHGERPRLGCVSDLAPSEPSHSNPGSAGLGALTLMSNSVSSACVRSSEGRGMSPGGRQQCHCLCSTHSGLLCTWKFLFWAASQSLNLTSRCNLAAKRDHFIFFFFFPGLRVNFFFPELSHCGWVTLN